MLPCTHFGFRAGYGCSKALLGVYDDILRAIDVGKLTTFILLDYLKAFHSLLMKTSEYALKLKLK